MPPRVTADLLLVGSVPARSTEEALRAGARSYSDLVFALPDGEAGLRRRSATASKFPMRRFGLVG